MKGKDNAAADAFSSRPDLFAIGARHIDLHESFVQELKEAYTPLTNLFSHNWQGVKALCFTKKTISLCTASANFTCHWSCAGEW